MFSKINPDSWQNCSKETYQVLAARSTDRSRSGELHGTCHSCPSCHSTTCVRACHWCGAAPQGMVCTAGTDSWPPTSLTSPVTTWTCHSSIAGARQKVTALKCRRVRVQATRNVRTSRLRWYGLLGRIDNMDWVKCQWYRDSYHCQAKETWQDSVCRLECDLGASGPCLLEESNWEKGKPSGDWKHCS